MNNIIADIIVDPTFPQGVAWRRHSFQANDLIMKEGDVGSSLFFIEQGRLRITVVVELENGRHMRTGICDLNSSGIFGESCLYESVTRNASVIAITEASVIELEGERLSIYLDAHPVKGYLFYKKLFETLTERLNHANHRVEYLLAWGLKAHDISKHLL